MPSNYFFATQHRKLVTHILVPTCYFAENDDVQKYFYNIKF